MSKAIKFVVSRISRKVKISRDAVERALSRPRRNRRQPRKKPAMTERVARLLLCKAASADNTVVYLKEEPVCTA
ncbi:hypothetical protein PF010_g9644 [Phytophthora fragariae]|uniref:Uncharacterized protein n=1 Tax=Phytophthora fragariae TaxID=53985 RepID=A0A6G0LB89_9STRA|nr:hypothetical protein PF010_g9644 [Phytophthora fragariae]